MAALLLLQVVLVLLHAVLSTLDKSGPSSSSADDDDVITATMMTSSPSSSSAASPLECQPWMNEERLIPQFHGMPELRRMPATPGNSSAGSIWWPGEMNDANTILEHQGVYHMMFQTDCVKEDAITGGLCAGGKIGSHAFSHLVSSDGVRWKRITDAISGTPGSPYDGADGDCDGTVSFPDGIGPVLLYGADCGRGKWPPVKPPSPSPPQPPVPPGPPLPPSKVCAFQSATDYKDGGVGANAWMATAEQCCAHCANTTGCAVAVFVHNPPCANGTAPQDCGQCYMKSSASQPYGKPGAVSCYPNRSRFASPQTGDYPRVAVALGNATDPLLQRWTKTISNPIQWEDPTQPASFPGRVWRTKASLQGDDKPRWSMVGISGEQGPYFRYETVDPQLHGPWVLADREFATTSDSHALGGGSNPDFYALPGPTRSGEPTHVLNAGKGGSFRLCAYHSETNSLKNCSSQVYDVGPGDWSTAGQADSSGAVLQAGWISCQSGQPPASVHSIEFGLSIMSAVRELRYDSLAQQLVTTPLPAYASLRNATLASSSNLLILHPNQRVTPGAGYALDIELTLALGSGSDATALEVQVLASAAGGRVNASSGFEIDASSILVNVSAPAMDGSRKGVLGINFPAEGPWYRSFSVLAGEGHVEIRVLVDRSVVEVWVAGGRATLQGRSYGPIENTVVHLVAPQGQKRAITISNYSIYSMGCGWL